MLKKFVVAAFLGAVFFLSPKLSPVLAQTATDKNPYLTGTVVKIVDQGQINDSGKPRPFQVVQVQLDDNPKNSPITIDQGKTFSLSPNQIVKVGDRVVVTTIDEPTGKKFFIVDQYRLDNLIKITLIFFVLVIILSRTKGLGSIVGLAVSLLVIIKFLVPQIISGSDPVFTSIIAASLIIFLTIFLAHGFNKRTIIALISTIITLVITGILAGLYVQITHLSGLGSDEAYNLTFGGPTQNINFQGLLLGGIIIGVIGVLDDITTGQSTSVYELAKANPKYTFRLLVQSSLEIGKEHISSLVNTLVLAYAGAALPIFLLIVLNPLNEPWWMTINSEFLSEEIVRTIVGSMGLVLAVPITTILAAWWWSRKTKSAIS